VLFSEALLHRVQESVSFQTLDGLDLRTIELNGEEDAALDEDQLLVPKEGKDLA
jgi:hypothetical protein